MLCKKCQVFCEDAERHVIPPIKETASNHPLIQHCQPLHLALYQLRESSHGCCPICRSIWNSIKAEDIDSLSTDCRVDLDITSTVHEPPVLSARFYDAAGGLILEKRSFATYWGQLASSKSKLLRRW